MLGDLGSGSNSIVVAVVDDAVEINHLDLTNVTWSNNLEIPNNGIDDDNNGYVDDYNGYDVADNDNNPNPPNTNRRPWHPCSWNFWSPHPIIIQELPLLALGFL